jgi:hypothetical protein
MRRTAVVCSRPSADADPPYPGNHDPSRTATVARDVGDSRSGAQRLRPPPDPADWDLGQVSTLPGGQTLREYSIVAVDKEFRDRPGVVFPGWVYNGRVPGPTLRCVEGDRIRIAFFNGGNPHTIHFHGIHAAPWTGCPASGRG